MGQLDTQKSPASIFPVTQCTVASTSLLQYLPYYCSMHLLAAAPALSSRCPPCYASTGITTASVIIFLLFFLTADSLLKHNPCECSTSLITALLKLCCCTVGLITVTSYAHSAPEGLQSGRSPSLLGSPNGIEIDNESLQMSPRRGLLRRRTCSDTVCLQEDFAIVGVMDQI